MPTYHRWKEQYGGADQNTVKRLKELEKENGRLKKFQVSQRRACQTIRQPRSTQRCACRQPDKDAALAGETSPSKP